jgi:hypothetical protein
MRLSGQRFGAARKKSSGRRTCGHPLVNLKNYAERDVKTLLYFTRVWRTG